MKFSIKLIKFGIKCSLFLWIIEWLWFAEAQSKNILNCWWNIWVEIWPLYISSSRFTRSSETRWFHCPRHSWRSRNSHGSTSSYLCQIVLIQSGDHANYDIIFKLTIIRSKTSLIGGVSNVVGLTIWRYENVFSFHNQGWITDVPQIPAFRHFLTIAQLVTVKINYQNHISLIHSCFPHE